MVQVGTIHSRANTYPTKSGQQSTPKYIIAVVYKTCYYRSMGITKHANSEPPEVLPADSLQHCRSKQNP